MGGLKVDIKFLESIIDGARNQQARISSQIKFIELVKIPPFSNDSKKNTYIEALRERCNNLSSANKYLEEDFLEAERIITVVKEAEAYVEEEAILLGQDMSFLKEGTTFYSTSAGGGNTGYIGNEWIKEGDNLSVGYLAVYSNGRYVGSISIYDEKKETLEEAINRYKEEGKIGEDDKITISQGLVKDLGEGKYGDVGWLDQIDYEQKRMICIKAVEDEQETEYSVLDRQWVELDEEKMRLKEDNEKLGNSLAGVRRDIKIYGDMGQDITQLKEKEKSLSAEIEQNREKIKDIAQKQQFNELDANISLFKERKEQIEKTIESYEHDIKYYESAGQDTTNIEAKLDELRTELEICENNIKIAEEDKTITLIDYENTDQLIIEPVENSEEYNSEDVELEQVENTEEYNSEEIEETDENV